MVQRRGLAPDFSCEPFYQVAQELDLVQILCINLQVLTSTLFVLYSI